MGALHAGPEVYIGEETTNLCHLQCCGLSHMVSQESVDLPREGKEYCTHYKESKEQVA